MDIRIKETESRSEKEMYADFSNNNDACKKTQYNNKIEMD